MLTVDHLKIRLFVTYLRSVTMNDVAHEPKMASPIRGAIPKQSERDILLDVWKDTAITIGCLFLMSWLYTIGPYMCNRKALERGSALQLPVRMSAACRSNPSFYSFYSDPNYILLS
jgi:hypothetical protein